MDRVTISQITGKPVNGRPPRTVPIWRVKLDNMLAGYVFEDDPNKGRVHFCSSSLSKGDMKFIREEVSEKLGTKPASTLSAPMMPEKPMDMPDFGDF